MSGKISIMLASYCLALAPMVSAQNLGTVSLPRTLADSGVTVQPELVSGAGQRILYSEGPVCDRNGNVFFSEQGTASGSSSTGSTIWKVTPAGIASKWRTGINTPNGNDFYIDGNMLCCEDTMLNLVDSTGKVIKTLVSGSTYGKINDLSVSSDGGIFFTDNVSHFWFRSKIGVITTFALTSQDPNGIEYVEEKGKLYVNLWSQNKVIVYNVGANNVVDTTSKKTFTSVNGPDGLTVDANYNVWVASNSSSGTDPGAIVVFDSNGTRLGAIKMTQKASSQSSNASNCVFGDFPLGGGPNPMMLYITGDSGCFKVQLKVAGRVRPVAASVKPGSLSVHQKSADRQATLLLLLGSRGNSWMHDLANPSILYNLGGRRIYLSQKLGSRNHIPGLSPAVLIGREQNP